MANGRKPTPGGVAHSRPSDPAAGAQGRSASRLRPPYPSARDAVVARRRYLPDLPTVLRRRGRRRHGRSGRDHRAHGLPRRPRRGRPVAQPVLHQPPGRPRLRHQRLPRRRSPVRVAGGHGRAHRHGPRLRDQGHAGLRAQPHLRPAPVVPGRAGRRARLPRARAVPVPRRPRPRRPGAAQQLEVGLRRPVLDPRRGARRHPRPVVLPPLRRRAARPQLAQPGGGRGVRRNPALLDGPRRRRLPDRRVRRPDQGRHLPGHPDRRADHPQGRREPGPRGLPRVPARDGRLPR